MGQRGPRPKKAETPETPPSEEIVLTPAHLAKINAAPGMAELTLSLLELPPPMRDGKPNPDHYRVQIETMNARYLADLRAGKPPPVNLKAFQDSVLAAAKLAGLDERDVLDSRTDAQALADTVEKMIGGDPDEATTASLQQIDLLIHTLEAQTRNAVERCREVIGEELARAKARVERGKAWLGRLKRLRALQVGAMEPVPTGTHPNDALAFEASHLLRFMIWTGRSNMTELKTPAERVFSIARHHARMSVDLWVAENGVEFNRHGAFKGRRDYRGAIIVAPPGHGKSEINTHWVVRRINKNHRTQGMIVHAVEGEASKRMQYIATYFNRKTPQGRRNYAMFPYELDKKDNNTLAMRLKHDSTLTQPTLEASGIGAAKSGANADFVDLDDAVDQDEALQDTKRERTAARIEGTLNMRLRGGHAGDNFIATFCTLWHTDDANNRRIKRAQRGEEKIVVSIQSCGGPEDGFTPLWPEMYPAAYLKGKYAILGPHLYSAAFRSNPEAEEDRIIRKVRLYDPDAPEHKRFLASCVRRLSIDPTATVKTTSDRAGIVYTGDGMLTWRERDQGLDCDVERTEMRVRVLDAYEIKATQTAIMEWSELYMAKLATHYVHLETVSGFVGLKERFDERFNIPAIPHHPGVKDKFVRLKACAPMLEDGLKHLGVRAIVEFPGERDESGELVPRKDIAWLVYAVERARMAPSLNGLDALTQVLNWLAATGDFDIGSGGESKSMRPEVAPVADGRGRPDYLRELDIARLRRRMAGDSMKGTADEQEVDWCRQN